MEHFDTVVTGSGIAGVSAAAEMARFGKKTLLMDMEEHSPKHSTGRSACLSDPFYVPNQDVANLAAASETFLKSPKKKFTIPRPVVHLFGPKGYSKLEEGMGRTYDAGISTRELTTGDIEELLPIVKADPEFAKFGVLIDQENAADIDPHALWGHYRSRLRAFDGTIFDGEELLEARRAAGRWVIRSTNETFTADVIVNAAGAWADVVAQRCGVRPIGMQPMRRTVVDVELNEKHMIPSDKLLPFIFWDGGDELYTRINGTGRAWISPADEYPMGPCDAFAENMDVATAIDRFEARMNVTVDLTASNMFDWAGLRTFTQDRRPVIGFDTQVDGFFWSAAFGGFGIECSPAASCVADALFNGMDQHAAMFDKFNIDPGIFAPRRETAPHKSLVLA